MDELSPEEKRAREKERLKAQRAKARKAKSAARKLRRVAEKLSEKDDLTEWEEEFTEGVTERLDKFGSAFHDPEKGGRDEALSYAQKAILSQLKKKEKTGGLKRSGFKSKRPAYKPNTRQLDEDFDDAPPPHAQDIPPDVDPKDKARQAPLVKKKPFLRIVKNED